MFPVYSVTHVPGLYPVLRSVGLLSVPYSTLAGASIARLVRPALSALRNENLCIIRAKLLGVLHEYACGALRCTPCHRGAFTTS